MAEIFVIKDEDIPSIESIPVSETIEPSDLKKNSDGVEEKTRKLIVKNKEDNSNHYEPSKNGAESPPKDDNENAVNIRNSRTSSMTTIVNSISIDETPLAETSRGMVAMSISLDIEKEIHQERAIKRKERFEAIVQNENVSLSFREGIFYLIGIVLIGFSSTLTLSLIPAHDVVQFPEYWYELLFQGPSGLMIWTVLNICIIRPGLLLNVDCVFGWKNVFFVLLVSFLHQEFMIVSSYYLWTRIFGYKWPIPFFGFIMSIEGLMYEFPLIWIRFPQEYRSNGEFRKRMRNFYTIDLYIRALIIIYQAIVEYIGESSEDYQPIVALTLPIMREISIWIVSKLIARCSNGDNKGAEIFLKYYIAAFHTIVVCYVIGSYTTTTTTWTLIGFDFLINVMISIWIAWKKRSDPSNMDAQINLLIDLAIYELVEFHAPLSYILVIFVAYHGPNATILGNVLNSYWKYTAIENIEKTLLNMIMFFFVDFSSTLVTGSILWVFSRINLWKLFVDLQKEFRVPFCVALGSQLVLVSNIFDNLKRNFEFLCF